MQITKEQVDTFKPGQQGQQEKRVPYCRLQIKLKDRNPTELVHNVELQGAKSPFDFFTITCPPKGNHYSINIICTSICLFLFETSFTVEYVERPARVAGERRQSEGTEQGGKFHLNLLLLICMYNVPELKSHTHSCPEKVDIIYVHHR